MSYEEVAHLLDVWSGIIACLTLPLIAIVILLTALRAAGRMSEQAYAQLAQTVAQIDAGTARIARAVRAAIDRVALHAAAWFTNQPAAHYRAAPSAIPAPRDDHSSSPLSPPSAGRDYVTHAPGVPSVSEQTASRRPADGSEEPSAGRLIDRMSDEDLIVTYLTRHRTRQAVIAALLMAGWSATAIRDLLRGDNNALSREIAGVKRALGMEGMEEKEEGHHAKGHCDDASAS